MSRGDVVALRGWERYRATWCRSSGPFKAEVARELNPDTRLIEWRALVWTDDRNAPALEVFTGQDVAEAVELASEVMGAQGVAR